MRIVADVAVALVAILHFWFLVLEMFLWTKPLGLKTFRLTPDFAAATKALAANQGLYNGFIAAGLGWGLFPEGGRSIKLFFLGCVVVAGVFGDLRRGPRSSGCRRSGNRCAGAGSVVTITVPFATTTVRVGPVPIG
jgi:putative membrane protein